MEERRLLCMRMKYSDCAWVEQLGAEGWIVQIANDLVAAHRQLQERPYLAGLLVPGNVDTASSSGLARSSLPWSHCLPVAI